MRYTPAQVFEHPWMRGHAPDTPLEQAQAELKVSDGGARATLPDR